MGSRKKVMIGCQVDADVSERITSAAAALGISAAGLIRSAVMEGLPKAERRVRNIHSWGDEEPPKHRGK